MASITIEGSFEFCKAFASTINYYGIERFTVIKIIERTDDGRSNTASTDTDTDTDTAANTDTDTDTAANTTPTQSNYSQTDANAEIIAQLQAQNAALMEQNANLNKQVVDMINRGAQFTNEPTQPTQQTQPQPTGTAYTSQAEQLKNLGMQAEPQNGFNPHSLSSLPDMTLEGLAGEIGKDRPMR